MKIRSLIIETSNGNKIDWFQLTRDQRRMFKKRCPDIYKKIKAEINKGPPD